MDRTFQEVLAAGIERFGLEVGPEALVLFERFAERMLAWNRKVNLTAITAPAEVAEKHVVDSLLVLRIAGHPRSVLDVGCGAGLPGIPLAIMWPGAAVVCCDSVSKKVAFVKSMAVELGLANLKGVAVRAGGRPEEEGLQRSELVVSRAVSEPEAWLKLARGYVAPGGSVVAMLGREVEEEGLRRLGRACSLELAEIQRFELPRSGAARGLARWEAAAAG